jgi:L-iditol 2-dehydrogenase
MRAALMRGPGDLTFEEVPDPVLENGGAIVEVVASTLCGTDFKMLQVGHKDLRYPRIPGHEFVGLIKEVDAKSEFVEGDLVQVWPGVPCGTCPDCRRGNDHLCPSIGIMGFNRDGGMAEKVSVPAATMGRGVFNIRGMEPRIATLAEPLACCINGQENTPVRRGDTVLIMGGGPIGAMHALLARNNGAGRILITEHLPDRIALLEKKAADRVIDHSHEDIAAAVIEETGGRGADVIFLATPEVRADSSILRLLAPRGRLSIFSGPKKDNAEVAVDVKSIHYHEFAIAGSYGCASRHNAQALELLHSRTIDAKWLITHRLELHEVREAFRLAGERKGMKITLEM